VDFPDDTDGPDSADIVTPMEALLDDVVALSVGYQVGWLANIAALEAVNTTLLPTGATRSVLGFGRYVLDKTTNPTFTADGIAVVQPTTGTGRWFAADDEAKRQYVVSFTDTAGTSFECPPNISLFEVIMSGGGGGGGSGSGSDTSTSDALGGGGGAGARLTRAYLALTPLHTYTMAPGAAGVSAAPYTDGGDGGNSGIIDPSGPTILLESVGGQGGSHATTVVSDIGSSNFGLTPGGAAPSDSPKAPCFWSTFFFPFAPVAGGGGYSTNTEGGNFTDSTAGSSSPEGGGGGTVGVRGATAGGHIGGAGGGGGGAGPFAGANGGAGGAGGIGAAGVGGNGGAGAAPAGAAYGAGGGGGGGGGQGGTGGSLGGASGAGMQGIITIRGVH
jgi:hypothetical protein